MNTISIFWTDKRELFRNSAFGSLLGHCRDFFVKEKGYRQPSDQTLIGRLLLEHASRPAMGATVERVLAGQETNRVYFCDSLCYTATGKPYFKNGPFHFSISHGGNIILLAACERHPVGADVVEMNRMVGAGISFLHPEEAYGQIRKEDQRIRYLSYIWARKEAFGKLTGRGVEACSHRVNVLGKLQYEQAAVSFFERSFCREYVCSVATAAPDCRIKTRKISPEELFNTIIHENSRYD